jgi:hypothetical protein
MGVVFFLGDLDTQDLRKSVNGHEPRVVARPFVLSARVAEADDDLHAKKSLLQSAKVKLQNEKLV